MTIRMRFDDSAGRAGAALARTRFLIHVSLAYVVFNGAAGTVGLVRHNDGGAPLFDRIQPRWPFSPLSGARPAQYSEICSGPAISDFLLSVP
jgi:hypothetical protein